jgi:hypothetical protein
VLDVPTGALRQALNDDPEFRYSARYWDASLRLGIGDQPLHLTVEDGRVEAIRPWQAGDSSDLGIDASREEWEELLAPLPRPFYQSLYGATVHHGFTLAGEDVEIYAYMAAVTRLIEVMRQTVRIH